MEGESEPLSNESPDKTSCNDHKTIRHRRLQLRWIRADAGAGGCPTNRVKNRNRSFGSDAHKASKGIDPCLSHGSVSLIGRRREMEDAVTVAPGFASVGTAPPYDFFGVYDGHCGVSVAWACRDRLHVVLAEKVAALGEWPTAEEQWREVMATSFSRVDGELASKEREVGSTASVAVVGPERIVVANCGDSRAVLSRGDMAVPLSSDHKADRPDERKRVEAAGGVVINWDVYRVSGVLATSRSIGDHYLRPYVISEPEVTVTNRTEEDELLVLASDGLWDVVSNEVVCKVASQCLSGQLVRKVPDGAREHRAKEAAIILAELALSRGSRDNISVVVVEL
ncbi:unnamed protein product [Musa textilis]